MSALTLVRDTGLIAKIRTEHEAAQAAAHGAVAHAIRCGELLIEAKATLKHGEFGPWLAANVAFSERTARGYMRLAGLDEAKRQRVADLSLRNVLRVLPKSTRKEQQKTTQKKKADGVVARILRDLESLKQSDLSDPQKFAEALFKHAHRLATLSFSFRARGK